MNTVNNDNNGSNLEEKAEFPSVLLYGLGNPLLDIVYKVDQAFPQSLGLVPGSMNLVDEAPEFGQDAPQVIGRMAGGSCANTMRGVAWLAKRRPGLRTAFAGTVGSDAHADQFAQALEQVGVKPLLVSSDRPTGTCTVMVTPDAERTMCTCLGASGRMKAESLHREFLQECTHLHSTGYFFETEVQRQALSDAVEHVRAHGATVSFDVSDSFVIERHRDALLQWLPGRVDTLFANRDEMVALTGVDGPAEELFERGLELVPEIALKLGADGCIVGGDDGAVILPAETVTAIDTNGAGDSFAAGFLFARLSGEVRADCARLANRLAGAMVTVIGCDYDAVAAKMA